MEKEETTRNPPPTLTKEEKEKRCNEKFAKKLAFSKYVKTTQVPGQKCWCCCGSEFGAERDIHRHVALKHGSTIDQIKADILVNGSSDSKLKTLKRKCPEDSGYESTESTTVDLFPVFTDNDIFPWLPTAIDKPVQSEDGEVLLFYNYRNIRNPSYVRNWQEILCSRLHLTGKVRVAKEGINTTVEGSTKATSLYVNAFMSHPLFPHMTIEDFKRSKGDLKSFGGSLKVGIYSEVVPMGVDPDKVSYKDCGEHLSPEEFHAAVERHISGHGSAEDEAVFIDCRNFYESKIGKFKGALAPDIRKFSYWPEYVDKNEELFKNKQVYMYCTGGIRCERGSAYLKQKGICQNIYQLEGGVHKYMEKYPDGYFRGKLFVFDDRYAIQSNDDVISSCTYCSKPWDKYKPCTSPHCHQLVLSCDGCRENSLTACCADCQSNADRGVPREECQCTKNRNRVPVESV